MKFKKLASIAVSVSVLSMLTFTGCATPSTVATNNVKIAAENFEISRKLVFYNTHLGVNVAEITGRISVETTMNGRLEVTVKTGHNMFEVHYLGLSRDMTYLSLQTDPVAVDDFRSDIRFRPESLIPNVSVDRR